MDELELKARLRLKNVFPYYAKNCLKIRSTSGEIKPFILNKAQLHIHQIIEQQKKEKGWVRGLILKGRQQGISSEVEGRYYWLTTHNFGVRAFILTHSNDATNNLFEMVKRYHSNCLPMVKPTVKASNAKELVFSGLESGYKIGTAGNEEVGRSSTIQLFHGSEVAYWSNAAKIAKGILQAVPGEKGTEIIFESTANGVGNYFHQQWQMAEAGLSDFIPIFVPWYWEERYCRFIDVPEAFQLDDKERHYMDIYGVSKEQLNWRRNKIIELSVSGMDGERAFMSEYPFNPNEAFIMSGDNSFIKPLLVQTCRKAKSEGIGRLIIGVDAARSDNDRAAIIRRKGRKAYNLQTFIKKTPTELAYVVHKIIIDEKPDLVVIDGSEAGGGAEVRDRLYDMGHSKELVRSILGGNSPIDNDRYYNKRAEMWAMMNLCLQDEPCEIPDIDELESDLCGVNLIPDSKDRVKLESKEQMKKRGIRSPDCADALAFTFAFPQVNNMINNEKQYAKIGNSINNSIDRIDRLKKAAYK